MNHHITCALVTAAFTLINLAAPPMATAATPKLTNKTLLIKGHPRLLLTDERLAQLKTQKDTEPVLKDHYAHLIKFCEEVLKLEPVKHELIGPRLLDKSREAIDRQFH